MENKSNNWLSAFEKNVYSQAGEDGILEKIFEIIKNGDHWCVEFGAWDGKFLSNTYNLIKNKNWQAVLIESGFDRYKDLLKNNCDNKKTVCLNRLVGSEGVNTLDSILNDTQICNDFDLLSIDIDGNDYHIWDSLKVYKPKVVVIEFNPSIPNDICFIQKKDIKVNQGSSLLALYNLAEEKGYKLVATTILNAFFVRREFFDLFGIKDNSPKEIFKNTKYQTKIFQLYDGTIVVNGCNQLIWHGTKMNFSKVNHFPKFLHKFPDSMSPYGLFLFRAWRAIFKTFYS